MTSTQTPTVKVDGPERLSLMCVPYNQPELIGVPGGPDGKPVLFLESFSADSWRDLPDRVPLNDAHNPERPLGWVALHSQPGGLFGDAELIGSSAATDALAQVRAGLRIGVSVGFLDDPQQDMWTRAPGRRPLPQVQRRGARLVEVSLVSRGAYPSARVLAVTRSSWEHQESEKIMAPYRAQKARELEQQRAADRALLAELDRLAAIRWDVDEDSVRPQSAGPATVIDDGRRSQSTLPSPVLLDGPSTWWA